MDNPPGAGADIAIEFRILGPLEVRRGGAPVQIGGVRQRALLALLLLSANRVVSRDRLIDELLPGTPRRPGRSHVEGPGLAFA